MLLLVNLDIAAQDGEWSYFGTGLFCNGLVGTKRTGGRRAGGLACTRTGARGAGGGGRGFVGAVGTLAKFHLGPMYLHPF
jgi:hypothetical protein